LRRLFRILRRLGGTLCGLFGTLISLLGASRGRGKVLLCLPQLGGERRVTQRFCVDVAAIDIEAGGQRRRFAIRRYADQVRCARQTNAGLEMCVATPIEHQGRRSRYGLSEQRGSYQRPLLHDLYMTEHVVQQGGKFGAAHLAEVKRIRGRAGGGIDIPVRRADDEGAVTTQDTSDLTQEVVLPIEMLDRFKRNDNVNAATGQRQCACVALDELKVAPGKIAGGAAHGRPGMLDADH
jgi:hypothetical protein